MENKWNYIDDKKLIADTLEIIMTEKCNFSCAHCLRGDSSNKEISTEVLDALFSKIKYFASLQLGGGEVTLNPKLFDKLYESLVKNDVRLSNLTFTTNGSVLSDELLTSLKRIEKYIKSCRRKGLPLTVVNPINICFSFDSFHLSEMERLGINFDKVLDNLAMYQHIFGKNALICRIACDYDVINVGRAKKLNDVRKVGFLTDYTYHICELSGGIYLGGLFCISTDGKFVLPNTPFNEESNYTIGDIKTDKISDVLSRVNTFEISDNDIDKYYQELIESMSPPSDEFDRFIEENNEIYSALQNTINKRVKLLKEKEENIMQ